MVDDEVQQAAADIELIKGILQRTTVSFSTLRPAFLGLAELWLVYALAETVIWVGTNISAMPRTCASSSVFCPAMQS